MKLNKICIKGFRSFAGEQTLNLTALDPGLYLVSGENILEPALEANGAGKSSLFEAVLWTLHGRTSRGLRASAIKNWASKSVECALQFEEGTCARGWGPNYLRLDGEEVDQDTLEKLLSINIDISLNAFYFAQGMPMFMDLPPTSRMDLYSTVLGLELWEEKSALAKDYAAQARTAAHEVELQHTRLAERHRTLSDIDMDTNVKAWSSNQAKTIRHLTDTLEQLNTEAETKLRDRKSVDEALITERKIHANALSRLETARAALEKCRTRESALNTAAEIFRSKGRDGDAELKAFSKVGASGSCSLCGQAINAVHRKHHLGSINARIAQLVVEHDAAMEQVSTAHGATEKAREAVRVAESATDVGKLATLRARAEAVEESLRELGDRMERMLKELERAEQAINPHLEAKKLHNLKLAKLTREVAAAAAELSEAQVAAAQFDFWVKGFKDVRYQVMQESLVQLNTEVNECLHELGLAGWVLEFVVEKETKGGSVKRGFQCLVNSPHTDQTVPWEAWSGGESQRLRLATQLGISNMLSARLGLDFNFEFWDEPTNYLTLEGTKALLSVLQERAQRYGKRILVADHRSLDYTFDGEVRVTKGENGSVITTI